MNRVDKLRKATGSCCGGGPLFQMITHSTYEKQSFQFLKFQSIKTGKVENQLARLNNDKQAGRLISLPICHIFNLSMKEGYSPRFVICQGCTSSKKQTGVFLSCQ